MKARFSFSLLVSIGALSAAGAAGVALGGCANPVELAFDGCDAGGRTIAVGVRTPGPCGESCVCTQAGELDCGPSLCEPPDPDPDLLPCETEGVVIPPGQSLLVETICQTCTCPAGGSADPAGLQCQAYEKPACMQFPPGCTESTEGTCTECPRCTCEEPPMGCPPPMPGCFYPFQGLCSMNDGDYCGPPECPLVCPPSDPVARISFDCSVDMFCDPNGAWLPIMSCPCGDLASACEMTPVNDPMSCRMEPSCDMQLPMNAVCTEVCQCDDPQTCVYPNVYDVDPLTSCGVCRPCVSCQELRCPMPYVCIDDPMSACGQCFPM